MKKTILLLMLVSACVSALYAQCPTSVTDGSGNSYTVIRAGKMCWTGSNLRTALYADGTTVTPEGMLYNSEEYNDVSAEKYGLLYTAAAAMRNYDGVAPMVQGVCPDGWHIPSQDELNELLAAYNVTSLLADEQWLPTTGSNASQIGILPAGFYNAGTGRFEDFKVGAYIWTTEPGTTIYHPCKFGNLCGTWEYIPGSETNAYSVRCVCVMDSVIFLPNGGTCPEDTIFVPRGKRVPLADYACTHDGNWEFVGWNTAADGTGDSYAADDEVITNGKLILYAQWHTWCTGLANADNEMGTTRIDSVKDADNNWYEVVEIGGQCWMKKNLRTTQDANGDAIDAAEMFNPNDDANNVAQYGLLYSWNVATGANLASKAPAQPVTRGICPEGWHVPSNEDWTQLSDSVSDQSAFCCSGNSANIAKALASATTDWIEAGDGTGSSCYVGDNVSDNNATGFSARPAGFYNGIYDYFGIYAAFWSAAQRNAANAYYYRLDNENTGIRSAFSKKSNGLPVRCLRDPEKPVTDTVAFIYNGGTCTIDTIFVARGENVALADNTCTRDGIWMFKGWNTAADGTGDSYAEDAEIITDGNITLYAQWNTACTVENVGENERGATSLIDSVIDIDLNKYTVVQIGNQCWMKENLRTETHNIGVVYTPTAVGYDVASFGRLYDWPAAMQGATSTNYPESGSLVQGICPTGWHVPSDDEWTTLTAYVSGVADYQCNSTSANIAKALASPMGWNSSSTACAVGKALNDNNATGFSAVASGCYDGTFRSFGNYADFWTSTLLNSEKAIDRYLGYNSARVTTNSYVTSGCFSIRCVRNVEVPAPVFDTVAFLPNGGQGTMDSIFVTRGTEVTIPANQYTRTAGFQFTGWNTQADGSGDDFVTGDAITANGKVVLYAQWHASCIVTSKRENENGTATLVDSVRDHQNNWYKVVQIGDQCWLKENMRCTTTPGGTNILENPASGYSYSGKKAYYVNGDAANTASYGLLYNWCAAVDTYKSGQGETSTSEDPYDAPNATFVSPHRGICPEGWHVPTDDEWTTMTDYVYGQDAYVSAGCNETSDESTTFCIAQALAATTGWNSSANNYVPGKDLSANNATGFSVLPAGTYFGEFDYFGGSVGFWATTQNNTMKSAAYYRSMSYSGSYVNRTTATKLNGFSVRCIRD